MSEQPKTAVALTVAGSDSGGGAGIQADLKTFAALGVYGCSAITSVTAQNTRGVQGVWPMAPGAVAGQMRSVLDDMPVAAIKTGMLASAEIIDAVAEVLAGCGRIPLVLDPVMLATSGDRLLAEDAVDTMIRRLLPLATLITPNLLEAAALLGESVASDQEQQRRQARRLLELGPGAVLVKGGHGRGAQAVDWLCSAQGEERLTKPRIATVNTHGTGCTLASAIAAGLAKGQVLSEAVRRGKDYLHGALECADQLRVGAGSGPVHHFYRFQKLLSGNTYE